MKGKEIESNDGKMIYGYNDETHEIVYTTVKGRVYSRVITKAMCRLLRKAYQDSVRPCWFALTDQSVAAINCYIMGRDAKFDATMSGPNSYSSKQTRCVRATDSLINFVLSTRTWGQLQSIPE